MRYIIPTAEPFLFCDGPIGCLLIHGFTGTPKEMRPLGEYLSRQGHTVLGIRLTGHATDMDDMRRARYHDWLADAESGYQMLHRGCDQVFVMGLSMGGALALMLASHYPVAGVVAMSTPLKLPSDPRLRFAKQLSLLVKDAAKGPPDWDDMELRKDHISYPAYPVRGVAELRDLTRELQKALPQVAAPALLVQARRDQSVPASSVEGLSRRIASKDKQILWLEKSGHIVIRDSEREIVFAAISDFMNRIAGERH
jgi:carboxylesterase